MRHNRKTLYTNMPTRTSFPRTLQEAFGPHAEWNIDRRTTAAKALGWVAALAPWLVLAAMWWRAAQ